MILADFGVGQVLWSVLWLSLFMLWFFLVVMVFSDIIVSDTLSGWGKALWAAAIIVLPYVGVFLYLVVNAGGRTGSDVEPNKERHSAQAQIPEVDGS